MLLLHWSMLNYAAVVKILKKHGAALAETLTPLCTQIPSAVSGLHALLNALYGCVLSQDCLSEADEQCTPVADKNSGVVLRAPFLATVLKQVRCPWCPLLGMPGPKCPCHMLLPGQTLFLWQEGISAP